MADTCRPLDGTIELQVCENKVEMDSNGENSFVKEAFSKFLEERTTFKRSIYFKVSLTGIMTAAGFYAAFVLLTFILQFQFEAFYSFTIYYDIYALSVNIFSSGWDLYVCRCPHK